MRYDTVFYIRKLKYVSILFLWKRYMMLYTSFMQPNLHLDWLAYSSFSWKLLLILFYWFWSMIAVSNLLTWAVVNDVNFVIFFIRFRASYCYILGTERYMNHIKMNVIPWCSLVVRIYMVFSDIPVIDWILSLGVVASIVRCQNKRTKWHLSIVVKP